MRKPDYLLIFAVVAPLFIWLFFPQEAGFSPQNNLFGAMVFFVLTPIIEEVLFRGFIQGSLLQQVWFKQISAGISRANWTTSGVFATAHLWQHSPHLFLGYFAVSLLLGYFREKYKGVVIPIFLHGYFNFGLIFFSS